MQRISEELGNLLKTKAKSKGFTQAEIANLVQVQKLMRHASIQTTMGYFNRDHMKQVDLVNQLGKSGDSAEMPKKING